jgi:hypothetical protein
MPGRGRRSNVAAGSHYKARTKKWLEARGYEVGHLERMFLLHKDEKSLKPGESPLLPIKKDQFGSDLLAVNDTEILFVQVRLGRSTLGRGRLEFAQHKCPPPAKQWIVIWERGGREPEVIDCTGQTYSPDDRARRVRSTLF